MEEYTKAATLDNEIEARLVASILEERHIPHRVRSYYDTAYDGLFQTQKGWGEIKAPVAYHQEITEIVFELRKKAHGAK